jgi:hypothetical protein
MYDTVIMVVFFEVRESALRAPLGLPAPAPQLDRRGDDHSGSAAAQAVHANQLARVGDSGPMCTLGTAAAARRGRRPLARSLAATGLALHSGRVSGSVTKTGPLAPRLTLTG